MTPKCNIKKINNKCKTKTNKDSQNTQVYITNMAQKIVHWLQ